MVEIDLPFGMCELETDVVGYTVATVTELAYLQPFGGEYSVPVVWGQPGTSADGR